MNTNTEIKKFLIGHRNDRARLKSLGRHGLIGAACTGRLAASLQDEATNLAIKVGENETLRRALIHNGRHPNYQSGGKADPALRGC